MSCRMSIRWRRWRRPSLNISDFLAVSKLLPCRWFHTFRTGISHAPVGDTLQKYCAPSILDDMRIIANSGWARELKNGLLTLAVLGALAAAACSPAQAPVSQTSDSGQSRGNAQKRAVNDLLTIGVPVKINTGRAKDGVSHAPRNAAGNCHVLRSTATTTSPFLSHALRNL